MDPNVARAYEAVTVSMRRLRPHLRYAGVEIEKGVRVVTVAGGPSWMWRDLFDSLEHSEIVRADAHLGDYRLDSPLTERPTTLGSRRRRGWNLRRKINLPRETLD